MSKIFFTADLHIHHANIIKYANRPFSSVDEMDEVLIENWNKIVSFKDTVYFLGDFCFGDAKELINKLNGRIEFIHGNHDRSLKGIAPFKAVLEMKFDDKFIVMCHYSMRVWNKSHYNSYHIFGHSHGTLEGVGKSFDVGVDSWNFTPITLEQVIEKMDTLPDNFNKLRDIDAHYKVK
jgi:calcineurin-like phosphoesterase family protein